MKTKYLITLPLVLTMSLSSCSQYFMEHFLAKRGSAEWQNFLGNAYYDGRNLPVDKQQAFNWYKKAAEQGYVASFYDLGWCYEKGEGAAPAIEPVRIVY